MNRAEAFATNALVAPSAAVRTQRTRLIGWCMFGLLVMMIFGPYMQYKPQPFTGEGSPLRQFIYMVLAGLVLVGSSWRRPAKTLAMPFAICLVLGWCWLSMTWSIAPEVGMRRLILTTLLMWTIFIAVGQLGYQRTIDIFRVVAIVTLIGNFIAVLAIPSIGIHEVQMDGDPALIGAWRGIMLQKNFAGAMCAFTIITFLFDGRTLSRRLKWSVIAGSLIFLWGTESKTSAGILLLASLCGGIYMRYNPRYRALLIPLVLVIGVAVILTGQIYWDDFTAPLYDPSAFTGRTQIWPPLLHYSQDNWFGAGYGSFWNIGWGTGPIFRYAKGWVADISSGHNGYVDLLVQIGVPGLILAILCLLVWPITKLLSSATASRVDGALLISLLVFCTGHNLTESTMLERDSIGQIILMIAIALTYKVTAVSTPVRPAPFMAGPVSRPFAHG